MNKTRRWDVKLLSALIVCVFFSGCISSRTKSSVAIEHPGVRAFSEEELEYGKQVHQDIVSSFYLYTEPALMDYVKRIGESLAGDLPETRKYYGFTVLYNDKIYATAAPGGQIYITTGLLNFIDSEAELAAVLAQEIAILQFQDPRLSNARKAMEGVTQAVAMVGPAFGQIGSLAALGMILLNTASQGNGGSSKEEQRLQADRLALRYMLHAGYDPQGLMDFFYRLSQAEPSMRPYFYDYYQTHPLTEERVHQLYQDFSDLSLGTRQLVMKRSEFHEATRGVREMYAL